MATGTIARKIADRGFSFVKPDEKGQDVFAHAKEYKEPDYAFDDAQEGDSVEYDTQWNSSREKYEAVNVRPSA